MTIFNVTIQSQQLENEMALISQLAKEVKDIGGELTLHAEFSADEEELYGVLFLSGDVLGISAEVMVC